MSRPRRATLADVARLAGVSASTASLTFSGSGPVSPATRERVLAAARELGFSGPDPLARSLRRGRAASSASSPPSSPRASATRSTSARSTAWPTRSTRTTSACCSSGPVRRAGARTSCAGARWTPPSSCTRSAATAAPAASWTS
nr:LacI family DNA-binding transcriptional regulator [Litorihabitans aurantiacus]